MKHMHTVGVQYLHFKMQWHQATLSLDGYHVLG
jgi:hypothetical protein